MVDEMDTMDESESPDAPTSAEASSAAPLFSVIVPVLDRIDLLPATLESVLAQRETDYELIVVDNGSSDGTPEMVARRYGDRVRLLTCERRGLGPPRNVGVAAARGRYIAFLDSDDLWFPGTLAAYRAALEGPAGSGAAAPAFLVAEELRFDDAGVAAPPLPKPPTPTTASTRSTESTPLRSTRFFDYFAASAALPFVVSCSAVVARADVVRAAGGFFEEPYNSEDSDLWLKLGTAPGFVWLRRTPGGPPLWAYRVRADNTARQVLPAYRGRLHMIAAERAGAYPGGAARARERRTIIARHTRPISFDCLAAGLRREAWELYRRTFAWHLALGRWRYLLGFPLRALFAALARTQTAK